MRILHTVEFYTPHIGGAERVVQRLSEGLSNLGHEVVVATSFDPRRQTDTINGVKIVQFRVSGNQVKGMRGQVGEYQRWLLDEQFDIVMNYAAQSWPTDAALSILDSIRGVKLLATCGFSGRQGIRKALYFLYYRKLRLFLSRYDALVYHAQTGPDFVFGSKYGPNRKVVIPNGVDSQEFGDATEDFRREYGVQGKALVLAVSNHYKVKGHHHFLQLAMDLADVDASFVLIGGDPGGLSSCWRRCNMMAKTNKKLRLLTGVPRRYVAAAFKSADIVVVTSSFEAAPLVPVEAMAAGVPFVSLDVGDTRNLPGGIVVQCYQDLKATVKSLLDDPLTRHALGTLGREYQRRYLEWDCLVKQYESLYWDLVREKASGK